MRNLFAILLFPVLFIIVSLLFKSSAGEIYLANNYDPSYVYLINALNVLNGNDIGHFDHPGTTVQESGAAIIFIVSKFSDHQTIQDILTRPEYYLKIINFVFVLLNAMALFMLGRITLQRTGSLATALILQLSPFISSIAFIRNIRMSPEPLLMFAGLLLLILIVSVITEKDERSKKMLIYSILFAIVCGFGIVTKISFFPLLIIPLILIDRVSNKSMFCLFTVIFVLTFALPMISGEHNQKFINWVKKIVLHSGKYGTGERNIVSSPGFINNLFTIISSEPVFFISYIIILISTFLLLIRKVNQKITLSRNQKLLIAIFLAISAQIIIVCKHFELHYLLPAFMITIMGLYAASSVMSELYPLRVSWLKTYLPVVLIALFTILQLIKFPLALKQQFHKRDLSREISKFYNDNLKDEITVSSYGASNLAYSVHMGSWLGGKNRTTYFPLVNELYPHNIFYDKWSGSILNTGDSAKMHSELSNAGRIIFLGADQNAMLSFQKELVRIRNKNDLQPKQLYSIETGEFIYQFAKTP